MDVYELSDREKAILRFVVHQFILTASPVGSRNISKRYDIGLSPATIRNIMADLEDSGLLDHPHTSAGRIPTDRGYRIYVDTLMDPPYLAEIEKLKVENSIDANSMDTSELLRVTSVILSELTNQLACITFPKFENAVLDKLQIISLAASRILVVLTIKSGLIKTITLEIDSDVDAAKLNDVQQILNEKLSGLKFSEIRKTFSERLKEYNHENFKPIVRVFVDSIDKIFTDADYMNKAVISGASKILKQPEFEDLQNLQGIIELIENKDVIIHLMEREKSKTYSHASITIGSENPEKQFSDYSMITKEYRIGDALGTVGIIGPKRMEYSRIVAAVVYVAESLTKELKKTSI